MTRLVPFAFIVLLMGCSRPHLKPAQQGPTQWQPAPGSTWVNRPMPTWPPSADGDYQPIDPQELAAQLTNVAPGQLVDKAHVAGGNPFVAQASYCVASADATAVAAQLRAALGGDGWQTTELGRQLAEAVPGTTQAARKGIVLTAYVAAGRWAGCMDPQRQTYVTFVAGKHK
jgi:hypothetical protein